ncbi:hypothetical protein [Dyadobacter sp. LHD-138]|uniref:hypothetical protein n=1 Tax=Dyadobacter sp. LHD-138 TaxID=3071413 RepID=UPI0027E0BDCC|nr:hypothetical protein [Dyadobacter sp. LHD-138]MDQ6478481.1 hypothetical protein [Dyadobacter sp. LHD-138]
MPSSTETITNGFKIRYDGKYHQIDASVFINSLLHITTIIQEINKVAQSDKKVEIKIKALEKGSFLVSLEIMETIVETLKHLFTPELFTLGAIITTLKEFLELKKLLKENKEHTAEADKETVKITTNNGNVIIIQNLTYEVYKNSPLANEAVAQNFETLQNDPSIDAFEITDSDENTLVKIEKVDFPQMSVLHEEIDSETKTIYEVALLSIIKISFEPSLKWEFYHRGNKIAAKIKDTAFMLLIDNGQAFSKGDRLEVELKVTQKYDQSVNTYVTKEYIIERIIRHIPRSEQQKINFTT